jgi:hypothetical protein
VATVQFMPNKCNRVCNLHSQALGDFYVSLSVRFYATGDPCCLEVNLVSVDGG